MAKVDAPGGERAPRAKVALVVRLEFPTADAFLVARSVDLSQSGMFIGGEAVTRLNVGDLVGVRFEVAGEQIVEAVAKVARVVDAASDRPPGVGVAFVRMARQMEELVGQVVKAQLADR
jgi:PilZ domain